MPDLIPVRFRDCACPGTPHPDGDVAYLRPFLDYAGGAEALRAYMRCVSDTQAEYPGMDALSADFAVLVSDKTAVRVTPILIKNGVTEWNLLDEDGEPVPVSAQAVQALRWEDAYALGDKADDLYGEQVFRPFPQPTATSSRRGPTVGSTRTPTNRSQRRRSPSRSSS